MKHPFWLVNSILAFILLAALAFMLFFRPKTPPRSSILPETDMRPPKKIMQKVDLNKIYLNDLFDTYKEVLPPLTEPDLKEAIPTPPTPKPVRVPLALPPKFLDPLKINLNGILALNKEDDNIAIIKDEKTGLSKNYHVGDKIFDAQLVRIMPNKIILIRSNGQQETLYVNQQDAEQDQMMQSRTDWDPIIQKKSENQFALDPQEFTTQISDLAQLIDVLNLTSVYKNGVSIGCRVGILEPKSLGFAMGLATGDIITHVNNIPATDTEARFNIYESVTKLSFGDTITVDITRNNNPIQVQYTLQNFGTALPTEEVPTTPTPHKVINVKEEQIKNLKERKKFAPTIDQLRNEQRELLQKQSKNEANRRGKNILFNTVK